MNSTHRQYARTLAWSFGLITLVLVVGVVARLIERPTQSAQLGYRGSGMASVQNTAGLAADAPIHQAPDIHKPARVRVGGPVAGTAYKNVRVLTELSIGEFGRTMTAMSEWVAPKESCSYCHVDGDFASDDKYTKVVARRMLEMVRHVNTTWKPHTGETGVTCYTCHRGQALPPQRWFRPEAPQPRGIFKQRAADTKAAPLPGLAVLPTDPLLDFLVKPEGGDAIRIVATRALVQGPRASVQHAEKTYGLMLHISKSLGVNCTFCHNSRAFADWPQSTPQRVTAWAGIQMVRDLNSQFMEPLGGVFPAVPPGRLGPAGDAAKLSCATCHLGTSKPLKGAQMARFYPALLTPYVAATPAAQPAAAAVPEAAASAPAEAASAPDNAASSPLELMARAPVPAPVPAPIPTSAATAAPAASLASVAAVPVKVAAVAVAAAPVAAAAPASKLTAAVLPVLPVAAAQPVSVPAVVAGVDPCHVAEGTASSLRQSAASLGVARRVVVGSGRLQFYSAPQGSCPQKGVFILPGEPVEAREQMGEFTTVHYVNPRNGNHAQGWVLSARLAAAPEPTARPDNTAMAVGR